MSETAEKIIYVTTNGPESPEKATLPFKLANAGLALDWMWCWRFRGLLFIWPCRA